MALCMGLCNIFCFRIWLAVRIHSRRAWLVAWGLTEWTMVKWGTSSKTWTEVLQRGHDVFSKGTLNRCHSWNDKKKSLIFSEKLNGQGFQTNWMFIGKIFTKVKKQHIWYEKVLQRGYAVFSKGKLNRCHSWNDEKNGICNSGLETIFFVSAFVPVK